MNSTLIIILTVFLVSCVDLGQLFPLPEPAPITNPQNQEDHETFMVQNGVTQEEIKEFHRQHGFAIPSEVEMEQQGQGRTLGNIAGKLKFWNWPAFENFRQWIDERRRFDIVYRTTTIRPIPVYLVNNPNSPYINLD